MADNSSSGAGEWRSEMGWFSEGRYVNIGSLRDPFPELLLTISSEQGGYRRVLSIWLSPDEARYIADWLSSEADAADHGAERGTLATVKAR